MRQVRATGINQPTYQPYNSALYEVKIELHGFTQQDINGGCNILFMACGKHV
jgi:hypothetical protein